jgi:hypothetical protein
MDEDLRELVFAESRPVIMRWLFLAARFGLRQVEPGPATLPNS